VLRRQTKRAARGFLSDKDFSLLRDNAPDIVSNEFVGLNKVRAASATTQSNLNLFAAYPNPNVSA
jgi:hypothetical protein